MKKINAIKNFCTRVVKTASTAWLVTITGMGGVQAELPVLHPTMPWSNNVRITQQTDTFMQIGQNQGRSGNWILNWQSFNISENSRVQFNQPSASHIALNRIYQNDASKILGSIDANGRIYLINQNGFVFGKNSSINVNSLVASSLALNISDDDFINNNKNIASLVGGNAQSAFDIDAFKYAYQDGVLKEVVDVVSDPATQISRTELRKEKSLIKLNGEFERNKDDKFVLDEQGNKIPLQLSNIQTQEGGNVILIAPEIINNGNIETPGGQTILAATSNRVYLTPSLDPALRGFLVEVDTGGSINNLGRILSARGNITLAGIAINQNGILEATTSVSENGSIRLLARDGAQLYSQAIDSKQDKLILGIDLDSIKNSDGNSASSGPFYVASKTGEVVLGKHSKTRVLIDTSDNEKITDAQGMRASRVEITGKKITLKTGSEIVAQGGRVINKVDGKADEVVTGGEVILHATENVSTTAITNTGELNKRDKSLIIIEKGSRIDVSGIDVSNNAQALIAMERNEIEVTLTGNFLRDSPLQRNGVLRNETITLDIRDGTPLGNIDNLIISNIKRDINELSADAGRINIISQGGVLLEQGSEIDISGGAIAYEQGFVTSSRLLTENDRLFDIADADPNLNYTSIFGELVVKSERWGKAATRQWSIFGGKGNGVTRFYQGYTEGKDAGSMNIKAYAATVDSTLIANTNNGVRQRELAQRAVGGSLNITLGNVNDIRGQSVILSGNRTGKKIIEIQMESFLSSTDATAGWDLQLVNALTGESGIANLSLTTQGDILLKQSANVNLMSGGKLNLTGRSVDINNNIRIVSGEVSANSTKGDVSVKGEIDTSGSWVNDSRFVAGRDLTRAANLKGGKINLAVKGTQGNLLLAESYLKANGGAWLKSNGDLLSGDGGSIKLSLSSNNNEASKIVLGQFEAYSAARGGQLSITANQINIANEFTATPAQLGELQFTPEFFQQGGFSDFTLISNADDITVFDNTLISPTTQSLDFNYNIRTQQSVDNLLAITEFVQLAPYAAPTTNLNLQSNRSGPNVTGEGLRLSRSAIINMTAGSNVSLSAVNNLIMQGEIYTAGGDVNLKLETGSGYKPDTAIWFDGKIVTNGNLNTQGELEASTFIQDAPNDQGLITGRVLNAGSVTFKVNSGYIITTENSEINASGSQYNLDLPSLVVDNTVIEYQSQLVSSEAGDVSLIAAEGMLIKGDINVNAANVEGASAGKLSVVFDLGDRNSNIFKISKESRELHLVQNKSDLPGVVDFFADTLSAISFGGLNGDALIPAEVSDQQIGKAWISAQTIKNSGADRLKLQSTNISGDLFTVQNTGAIILDGNIDLQLSQSLELIAPIIRAQAEAKAEVNLSAPYVLVGSITGETPHKDSVTSTGNSTLNIMAGLNGRDGMLELMGELYLQGLADVNLYSEGDIRLRGVVQGQRESLILGGSLNSWNGMRLQADQVYATTLSQFELSVDGNENGILAIQANGDASVVLSAGSVLNVSAPVIQQFGVLKAPQGSINFNADKQIIFGDQSITSVSAEGQLVPFGITLGEERWIYPFIDEKRFYNDVSESPAKKIIVQSDDIQISNTAVFDISGGGDLSTWEFVPGLGGSVDTLLTENANGAFAVIPGSPTYAAYDYLNWKGETNIKMGDQVYLAGNSDLAEGLYTILPARYALLPGAQLITPTGDTLLPSQQFSRLDGAPIVPGQFRVAGTDVSDNLWTGFVIESSDAVRLRSEYFETTASQFFREASLRNSTPLPFMPEDAGVLSLFAGSNLDFSGVLLGEAAIAEFRQGNELLAVQGRGSLLNISGNNIRIVTLQDNNSGIQIEGEKLNAFNAGSILLGGERLRTAEGTNIITTATDISIDQNVNLTLPELILVAKNKITLNEGVTLTARGDESVIDSTINVSGDGALLRASVNNQVLVNRTGESSSPTQGLVTIKQGAAIDALKSVVLDASVDIVFLNDLAVMKDKGKLLLNGGALTLASTKLTIGDFSVSDNVTGVSFTTNELEAMNVNDLVLSSRNGIDLYGNIELNLNNVEFETGSINGYQKLGEVFAINASQQIKLSNASAYVEGNLNTAEGGELVLNAADIKLMNGNITLSGFTDVSFIADKNIITEGVGVLSSLNQGALLLDGRLTTVSNADYAIKADTASLLIQRSSNTELNLNQALGGKLKLSADNITHTGQIDMASGYLQMDALGTNGNIILTDGSLINLRGIDRDFAGELIYTPGGKLTMNSKSGDIQINQGSFIDLSSSGNAGSIKLKARQGTINFAADLTSLLRAQSGANSNSGSFSSESLNFTNLSQTNQQLNMDFNQRRYIHLGAGDIDLGMNESIIAQDVSLQTDNGVINLFGLIDASGGVGGKVHLAAQKTNALDTDVLVNFSGRITAAAKRQDGEGGDVLIESRGNGLLDLVGSIDVSGGVDSRGGKIHIRTPRTAANDDVNINRLDTNKLLGYRRLDVEAYSNYTVANVIDSTKFTATGEYILDAKAFMLNVNSIMSRLGMNAQDTVRLRAGIELISEGDLTLNNEIDFIKNLAANTDTLTLDAGVLSLRAKGNINLNAILQDGFKINDFASSTGGQYLLNELQKGESWSYNIVAGANLSAASVQSLDDRKSNIYLASNVLLRTGTGDISMLSTGDITLAQNAAIYTAGQRGVDTGIDELITLINRRKRIRITSSFVNQQIVPGIEFPEQGGDLSLSAGGNLTGDASASLLISDWLYRVGPNNNKEIVSGEMPHMTGISFANFANALGALGGGDINIDIAGSLQNLSVSIPTTEKYVGDVGFNVAGGSLIKNVNYIGNETRITGSGDINVVSGGNITQSLFYTGDGSLNVIASGSIGDNQEGSGIYLIVADTKASVFAGGDLNFQGVSSANLLPFSTNQVSLMGETDVISISNYYSNYTENTAVELTSLSGVVDLRNTNSSLFNTVATTQNDDLAKAFEYYPGKFKALAIDNDIDISGNIILWPSTDGGLSLLAQNNITSINNDAKYIKMLDIDPQGLPGKINSITDFNTLPDKLIGTYQTSIKLLHKDDKTPSRIVANTGDVSSLNKSTQFAITTNEQLEIFAGRDVLGIDLSIQNNAADNISTIQAGRDIRHINSIQLSNDTAVNKIEINGPGELQVLAGRDINLGDQRGIIATANSNNPALPSNGAELLIMAGLGEQGADFNAFIDAYFTAQSEYANTLIDFMNKPGAGLLNFDEALNQFKALQEKQQRSLLVSVFSNEMSQSATRAAKEQAGERFEDKELLGYSRGIDAIATLFPGTIQSQRPSVGGEVTGAELIVTGGTAYVIPDINAQYSGNVFMVASAIQTQGDGADISILVPGGFLNVGLSVSLGDDQSNKGIVTKGNGNINLFTQGDIAVNQSRVQALNGGNVMGWSTKGDIDAGRGAKDALVIPPPRTTTNSEGVVIQVFDVAVQGNGIRTACADIDCLTTEEFDAIAAKTNDTVYLNNLKRPGNVTLGAPAGVIDAGDAGIDAGGNLILATDTVLNSNQIKAGGESTGVPVASSALGADLGGLNVNSEGEDAATELVASDASDQFGRGSVAILQVEIMGLSGEQEIEETPSKDKKQAESAEGEPTAEVEKSLKEKSGRQVNAGEKNITNWDTDLSMNVSY